jgi:hypothetical protein
MTAKRGPRIGQLTSVGRVAIEVGRIYRAARRGDIDSIEAYRLASVLSVMAKCLETTAFEQRIAELEGILAQQRKAESFRPRIVS